MSLGGLPDFLRDLRTENVPAASNLLRDRAEFLTKILLITRSSGGGSFVLLLTDMLGKCGIPRRGGDLEARALARGILSR